MGESNIEFVNLFEDRMGPHLIDRGPIRIIISFDVFREGL